MGLPKCGKKVLVELCTYLIHGKIYRINDNYDEKGWYESIRISTKEALANNFPSVLLVEHIQLK